MKLDANQLTGLYISETLVIFGGGATSSFSSSAFSSPGIRYRFLIGHHFSELPDLPLKHSFFAFFHRRTKRILSISLVNLPDSSGDSLVKSFDSCFFSSS